jgi:hypothetical protein
LQRLEAAMIVADLTVRETARLIGSDKVEGTYVRRTNGDKIGSIERVMIDKRSGKAAYAVMMFGGSLGVGSEYRALPWSTLRYNERLDAYELNLTDDQLRTAPVVSNNYDTGEIDRGREDDIRRHYRVTPYW